MKRLLALMAEWLDGMIEGAIPDKRIRAEAKAKGASGSSSCSRASRRKTCSASTSGHRSRCPDKASPRGAAEVRADAPREKPKPV